MTLNNEADIIKRNKDLQYENYTGFNGSKVISIYDCSVCSLPICDQYIFKVNENHFHSICLSCSECHMKLFDKCYTRDGNVYCREDFFKKFGTKCSSCGSGIAPSEVVRRANACVYHLKCFSCLICHRQLNTGDKFYLLDNQKLVCKIDYDALAAKEFDDTNKRPRTTITQKQLEVLKQAYSTSSKPARHVRESLATDTGLDMRVVQVWFQNRRAKEKRLKKDNKRQWQNTAHTDGKIQRKKKRTKNDRDQSLHEEDATSTEVETAVSYDELSENDSSDSLSNVCYTNPIYSNVLS